MKRLFMTIVTGLLLSSCDSIDGYNPSKPKNHGDYELIYVTYYPNVQDTTIVYLKDRNGEISLGSGRGSNVLRVPSLTSSMGYYISTTSPMKIISFKKIK